MRPSEGVRVPPVLTFDLEEWFHGLEADPRVWATLPRRVSATMPGLLDLLEQHGARATFFVVGDVAAGCPALIREIAERGHEIGVHGMLHRFVRDLTPAVFRDDLRQAIGLLEDIVRRPVVSYRAPYFSITAAASWAFDVLVEEGIRYDSSIFPVRVGRCGNPGARRTPHEIRPGLWEWPVSSIATPLGNLPLAGGAYLRLYPWRLFDLGIRILERRSEPCLFYLHPWELDSAQPLYRSCVPLLYQATHYWGLKGTHEKLSRLLARARYVTLACGMERLRGALEDESIARA